MQAKQISDLKTFTEYLKEYDPENLSKYLILIKTLQEQSTHDILKLSVYVLNLMEKKDVFHKFPYFQQSVHSNIHKLNDNQERTTKPISPKVPFWLNQNIEKKLVSKEKQQEMEEMLNEYKRDS